MELEKAKTIADHIKFILGGSCERIAIAGSIRRRQPDVGDIELLCIPQYLGPVDMLDAKILTMIHFELLDYRLNKRGNKMYGHKNKLLVHVPSGIGVDIFSTDERCWPVALVVRTGGKISNMEIATRALARGMKFRAYGDGFDTPEGHLQCKSEAAVFNAVGLQYLEPWERR